MNNILNRGLWLIFTVLTPLTFVGLFSQNSIPGDILYPVKIGIENACSVVFSFTPEAHASYSTSLTTRRFEEAEQLIAARSDTQGLKTLVTQTEKAQVFKQLHIKGRPLILVNIWDAGTAKAITEAGAKAIHRAIADHLGKYAYCS